MVAPTDPEALDLAGLTELRQLAQDLANRPDWPGVLALEPRFRLDQAYWIDVWAPLVAVAAAHTGDARARAFLDEAIAAGFCQPENLEGELEARFGADPDWPALVEAMASNVPPAPLQLVSWPELTPAHPLRLAEIAPDRRDALRERLPQPDPSAWATARELLRWSSSAWQHSGSSHVDWSDAVHVLDRVAAGERFACIEYTVVLSQALNAVDIPARSVGLLCRNHHMGVGRVHAVSEAWIDDLGRWVLLDGQNGMYWVDDDGHPMSLIELRDRLHAGRPSPAVVSLAGKSSTNPELWYPYFFTVHPAGVMISGSPYAPAFETTHIMESDEVRTTAAGAQPDLLELGTGITDLAGRPGIAPMSRHPYALGFQIALGSQRWDLPLCGQAWPIPTDVPGESVATISTVTRYGTHGPHPLRYVTLPH